MARDEIIGKIDTSWDAWITALDGIPAESAAEPGVCGYYSIKDLIGHIAYWDEQDLARAHKLARGEDVQPNDWAAMNDREYEQHKDDTLEQQSARMLDAHARLSADALTLDHIESLRLSEVWEHYDEHRGQVLSWRERKGL